MSTFDPAQRVLTAAAAQAWRQQQSGRVVFTNGVFDLLHPGHVDILRAARECGNALIVGINSDASVRRLKGPDRPVRPEVDRAYVLAAMRCVDVVTVFDEDTPLELVRLIAPDVIVKGGDYTEESVVGASQVRARGGDVVIVPLTPHQSTTSIIETLRAQRDSRSH